MFRELTRIKQKLSPEECKEVLRVSLRGVLALNGEEGYPYALPINFYYDEDGGVIYFHSGKSGYKIDCIEKCDKACFTAIDDGVRHKGEWWLTIRSVVAFGKVKIVTDQKTVEEVSYKLSKKFTQDDAYVADEIKKYAPATAILALYVEDLKGKRVREK